MNTIVSLGSIPNGGTHRARIQKVGKSLTFSIDAHYNGIFSADMSHTFADYTTVAPYLNSTNSRLFFGTTFPNDRFDDMRVVPEPSTMVLAVLGLSGIVPTFRRRLKARAGPLRRLDPCTD